MMCCFDSVASARGDGWCCSECRLEHEGSFFSGTSGSSGNNCGPLENNHIAFIFMRFEQQVATKVRSFSSGCTVDGSGCRSFGLSDVKPRRVSIFLAGVVRAASEDSERKNVRGGALAAIAIHDDCGGGWRHWSSSYCTGQPDPRSRTDCLVV